MVNDPISDFLTRLRNATLVSKSNVEIPHSKFKYETRFKWKKYAKRQFKKYDI